MSDVPDNLTPPPDPLASALADLEPAPAGLNRDGPGGRPGALGPRAESEEPVRTRPAGDRHLLRMTCDPAKCQGGTGWTRASTPRHANL